MKASDGSSSRDDLPAQILRRNDQIRKLEAKLSGRTPPPPNYCFKFVCVRVSLALFLGSIPTWFCISSLLFNLDMSGVKEDVQNRFVGTSCESLSPVLVGQDVIAETIEM